MINERNVSLLTTSRTYECTNKLSILFALKKASLVKYKHYEQLL